MKSFPNFESELHSFIQDEARREATAVLSEKDPPRTQFTLQNLREFSYEDQLDKFQRTNPILVQALIGTLSKEKVSDSEVGDISRKGFGGPGLKGDISLAATGKQL